MGDRTTISVSEKTKELLSEQRGGRTWDAFLHDLATGSEDRVKVHPDSVAEIAELAASKTTNEIEFMFKQS